MTLVSSLPEEVSDVSTVEVVAAGVEASRDVVGASVDSISIKLCHNTSAN